MKPVELVVRQTVVSVRLLVRMQPVDSGCLNSDTMGALSSSSPLIGLLGPQALRGAPGSAPCHLWPRSIVEAISAQSPGVSFKGLLPTSCHLVFYFGQRVHFLFHSLHPRLPFPRTG